MALLPACVGRRWCARPGKSNPSHELWSDPSAASQQMILQLGLGLTQELSPTTKCVNPHPSTLAASPRKSCDFPSSPPAGTEFGLLSPRRWKRAG